ncbi:MULTISPECIES: DUF982 domain-containing protein [unclassified Mesorhizobium]|uniref:DUF982 domain-containing protein n=1 Tax=unclassified Mesorhizobium TaxID=325217 RepID=UPI000FCA8E49|nr:MULTISPECIES: DUF982 domain-containing protein [unclassified Mesorhizobium]TIT79636.1 MAG: DUF982 domain-containing protein [Mesorhizobium sp.]TGP20301.1 DUF982 domain-containing protein [Mesorhizobium sp. M1D.F.Ca.ET.231.01.1.1]TGP27778.1 DUF982 domain-containing protein [Mesorhizobium sp. M1D.F.Ca.ET.234.01.1.1]TGS42128.1 DUF982 domain-containing protein [Mesorhizobium sp. M1D.F.Ca.ET.184.01.1.1]TGS59480.1 DUF982 domain-containing protein [Mesorhizobium sp. M1D.F.Ca.ET.183.01.1.1]
MNEALVRSDMPFRRPVAIAVGAGFRRDIASLAAMENFLTEWPPAMRGDCYRAAVRACEAARTGDVKLQEARRTFLAFAQKAGILWTGIDPVTALREAKIRRVRARRENQPRL